MNASLHKRVEENLLEQIQTGVWPVGSRLPKEEDMASQLGVSRSTLRQAFASLERKGVLLRKKRAGTKVISDQPVSRFSMVTAGLNEVLSLVRDASLDVSGIQSVAEQDIAVLQGLQSETGNWLEITGTRSMDEDDVPFNWSQIYVTGRYAGIGPVLGERVSSVFEAIESTFGIRVARVSQAVLAIACPQEAASAIDISPGAPALQIVARLFDEDDQLLEVSSAIFDPDRFQVQTDVRIE
ncbi:MAG: GntR family transcriptional regulator [Hyphomicrobiales bacterium]